MLSFAGPGHGWVLRLVLAMDQDVDGQGLGGAGDGRIGGQFLDRGGVDDAGPRHVHHLSGGDVEAVAGSGQLVLQN